MTEHIAPGLQVQGICINRRSDNVLRPELNIAQPRTWLEQRQYRGPAGTKTIEEPFKDGAAFVPIIVAWSAHTTCPKCSNFPPQYRHRAAHSVLAMAAAIWLDVDDTPRAEIDRLLAGLESEDVAYTAYSSHSYGRADKADACPCRIVVYADRTYPPELAKPVRSGFAARYGIKLDRNCLHPASLFYLPSCPDDPQRKAMAWVRHGTGHRLVNPLDYVPAGFAAMPQKERPNREAASACVATREALEALCADHPNDPIAARVIEALRGEAFTWPEDRLRAGKNGRHGVLQSLACWVYSRATEVFAPESFWPLLAESCAAVSEIEADRRTVDEHEVTSLFRWAFENVAAETEESGRERLQAALDDSQTFDRLSRADAESKVRQGLAGFCKRWRGAADRREKRPILVLAATPGFGKSHLAREMVAESFREGQETVWAAPTHNLLAETQDRFRELGVAATYRGGQAARTDRIPTCPRKAELKPITDAGLSIWSTACPICPQREECPARRYRAPQRGGVELVPHAMIEQLFRTSFVVDPVLPSLETEGATRKRRRSLRHNQEIADRLLVIDEEFATHTVARLSRSELVALHEALANDQTLAPDSREAVRHRVRLALEGKAAPASVAPELRLADGVANDPYLLSQSAKLFKSASAVLNWTGAASVEGLVYRVVSPNWRVLQEYGGIVLSATATRELWRQLGAELLDVHVEDSHPTVREIDYRADAGRKGVFGAGDEHALARTRREVEKGAKAAAAAGVQSLLVVTYKRLAEALELDAPGLGLDRLEIAHFGSLCGIDKWRDFDGCLTVWDPWPAKDAAALVGELAWRGFPAAELCQAHGRLRDPSPGRSRGGWHRHVGQVVPWGWAADNAVVVEPGASGRPRGERDWAPTAGDVERAVGAAGGLGAFAERLGVGAKSVQHWRNGTRPLPAKHLGAVLDLIGLPQCEGVVLALREVLARAA